jgi:Ca2+-binding EF-hand superfamily protein
MADSPRTAEARQLFDEIDADRGGTLDRSEIKQLAKRLGKRLSEKQLHEAMMEMDADGSGEVAFDEFVSWWKGYQDRGGGGLFSGLSLDFLKSAPPPPPETELERNMRLAEEEAERQREARQLFDEIDEDGGGTLDRDEIKQLAKKLGKKISEKQLSEAMLEMDADSSGDVCFEEFYYWWKGQQGTGGGIFSGISLDFLTSTPPPETEEERAARVAAEEAEAARLAERNRWLRGTDDATAASVAVELLQRVVEAQDKSRCPVCTLPGCRSHSQEPRDPELEPVPA